MKSGVRADISARRAQRVKDALADIIAEVSRLEFITVNGEQYKVEYYMGGDWKFLAIITGMSYTKIIVINVERVN